MADPAALSAALVSIHPRYVDEILHGQKRFEFRRRPFARDVSVLLIYATRPVGLVMGHATVRRVIVDCVDALWEECSMRGGIAREEYDRYFAGANQGVAVELDTVCAWEAGLPIGSMVPDMKPPQSFAYVPTAAADAVCARQTKLVRGGSLPMPNLMPSEIVNDVRAVLEAVAAGTDSPPYLTAYQILGSLPSAIRERLVSERRLGGAGAGVRYSAARVVADAAGMLADVEGRYIDARGLTVSVAGEVVSPGHEVAGIYRLVHRVGLPASTQE